jgi:LuxR family transcriptional regulator, quorum-sensing system regulator SdiA
MTFASVARFKEDLKHGETLEHAGLCLEAAGREMGFDAAAYIYAPKPRGMDGALKIQSIRYISKKLHAFDKLYESKEYYRFDPVYQLCLTTTLPVAWTYRDRSNPLPNAHVQLTGIQAQLASACCRLGLANGITVPLHGPGGQLAAVSFLSEFEAQDFLAAVDRHYDALFLIAHHFHAAVAGMLEQAGSAPRTSLSQRELDCLRLVAQGKTNEMIGAMLGLAEITVRFHLSNARVKLGACNRSNAVAKATELGLLGPVA